MISNPDIDFYPVLMSEEIHCKKRFDLNFENLLFLRKAKIHIKFVALSSW